MAAEDEPNEHDRATIELGERQSLHRLRNVSIALVPILIGHILYFALSAAPGMTPAQLQWRLLQRNLQSGILLILLALMAASLAAWRQPAATLGWRSRLPPIFGALFVWATAAVAVVDQLITGGITPFITASLAVALLLRLSTRAVAVVYVGGFLILEVGVQLMGAAADARMSVLLNGVTVAGVSLVLSVTLTRAFHREERARRTIENQSKEIARLRDLMRVCAWCKRVSNEKNEWEALDAYVSRTSGRAITHGMCDECFSRQVPSEAKAE